MKSKEMFNTYNVTFMTQHLCALSPRPQAWVIFRKEA